MDLKTYYKRLREVESSIYGEYAVIVSRPTDDGGKPGVLTEAHRSIAAGLVAEGRAELAGPEQTAQFHAENAEKKLTADAAKAAKEMQVVLVSGEVMKRPRSGKESV
ncbi:MAG: hypothetical protein NVSMB62_25800 [Acidobacteriaceae bacterium]